MAPAAHNLRVKLFADGADKASMLALADNPLIKGFTTNPTLMRKAGISDYERFSRDILAAIPDRPVSLEVFSDDFDEMYAQALKISSWGGNVYVKIPVTNTTGASSVPLLRRLAPLGVKMNVTALFTLTQVQAVSDALADAAPSNISVFAGRIADAGVDPMPVMQAALAIMKPHPTQEMIWASPREVYNVVQADEIGCHIITVPNDIIAKLSSLGKDLEQFSLETVRMFRTDAIAAGFQI
jgi:transaldolase